MHRITQVLSVGRFASQERAELLRAGGVTHILNVSDSANVLTCADGFEHVAWVPMSDSRRLPPSTATLAIDTLHRLVTVPGSHVYVHCILGAVRSPTVLWLYLIACGIPSEEARRWIRERSPNADPGYRVVDQQHIRLVQQHGLMHFSPHPRREVIEPFEIPSPGADASA